MARGRPLTRWASPALALPLMFHHFPPLPREEDCLRTWKIIGHYRYFPRGG